MFLKRHRYEDADAERKPSPVLSPKERRKRSSTHMTALAGIAAAATISERRISG